ncbi:MAG TPA: hypothetical protein VGX23_24815 [Actinocrinis sp.]|nr:hypothetical protein [Actinocrinis sp.]
MPQQPQPYGASPYGPPGAGQAQGPYPYPYAYPPQLQPQPYPDAVGQAPQFSFKLPITTQDVLQWLRGGAILTLITVAAGFVLAGLVGLLLPGPHHGNPADWFSAGLLVAGMAVGGRVGISSSSFDAGDATFNESFDLRISALLITVVVLLALRTLGRRGEQRTPSTSLRNLTVRALGTGLLYTALMALPALAVHIHALYGYSPFGGVAVDGAATLPGANSVGGSAGALVLSAGSMFLWPLLLSALILWGSAFAVWLRAGATTSPNPTAAKMAWLWTCRPAFLAVRAQVLATTVLAGVGFFVYAVLESLHDASQSGTDGGTTARVVFGLLLALPNFGALAGSVSLGASITGFGPFANILGVVGNIDPTNIDPNSTGASPYTSTLSVADSSSFGFFGGEHPAVAYLLIAVSVMGTLGAAKWAVGKSWDRSRALLGPGQAWRGAVIGALLWAAVGVAAQLMESTAVMDMGTTLDIGPSLPGLLLAGAVWGLLTCLAVSYFAGHLTATPIVPTGPVNPGEAGLGGTGAYGSAMQGTGTFPAPQSAAAPTQAPADERDDVIDMGTVITLGPPDPEDG